MRLKSKNIFWDGLVGGLVVGVRRRVLLSVLSKLFSKLSSSHIISLVSRACAHMQWRCALLSRVCVNILV